MARVALLIGVSDYGPGFNWMPGVVKDLEAMQRILQNPLLGDFSYVQTLKNPDPLTMQRAIALLFTEKVREYDDLVLLFFSGHCVNDDHNQLYFTTRLSCKNSQGELVKSTAVPATFVQDIMNDSLSRQQVVILDCCLSNAFANIWLSQNSNYVDIKNQLGGEGRVVLTAATSTQELPSHKGFDLSSYTRYLVEGIETGIADLNQDKSISAYELHQYISRKVEESTVTLEPTIYTVGESYNIGLTKAPIGNLKQKWNEDSTESDSGGASDEPSAVTTEYDLRQLLADKPYHLNSTPIHRVNFPLPNLRNSQSVIGASLVTVLLLAGTIYTFTHTQDLQHLPMGESIAADTKYKNQVSTVFEHRNTVWCLVFSPDSQLLASSSGDKTIKLWQLKNSELFRVFPSAHLDTIWSIAISPDGQTLVSGSGDKTIKIWNLKTGELLRTIVGHTDTVRSVAISPDGQIIVSGSGDKTVKIWNLKTGQLLRTIVGHTDTVRSVAISPNGQIIASGGKDNTVRIWNLQTGQLLHTLKGHTARIISVAISPNGQMVASGGNDNTIKLWNIQTGALLHTLSGHSNHVNSIAFRADGMLVSGAEDRLIKLWNPQTGELLNTISRHDADVYAVAISPDGKTLASGDKDGEIKLGH